MASTVAQINTLLGTNYLAVNDGLSAGYSIIPMLNLVMPRLYAMGPWKALKHEISVDCSPGYYCLRPDYESILMAIVNDVPAPVQGMSYEYQERGPWIVQQPAANLYGIIDEGFRPILADIPTTGIDYLEFTSVTGATFDTSDIVTVTFTDDDDGYFRIAIALNSASTSISSAATYNSGAETNLAVTSSTGFSAGQGVTISGASDTTYNGDWRITAVPDGTHIAIKKAFVAGAITGSIATNRRLIPNSNISAVDSVVYASLPSRVTAANSDDLQFLDLPAGDGVAQYRRYQVPQPPLDTSDEWTLQAIVKRAWIPVTATTDIVYLDDPNILRYAFMAIEAGDKGDEDRAGKYWGKCKNYLNEQLTESRGGARGYPQMEVWGRGIPSPSNLYYSGLAF